MARRPSPRRAWRGQRRYPGRDHGWRQRPRLPSVPSGALTVRVPRPAPRLRTQSGLFGAHGPGGGIADGAGACWRSCNQPAKSAELRAAGNARRRRVKIISRPLIAPVDAGLGRGSLATKQPLLRPEVCPLRRPKVQPDQGISGIPPIAIAAEASLFGRKPTGLELSRLSRSARGGVPRRWRGSRTGSRSRLP